MASKAQLQRHCPSTQPFCWHRKCTKWRCTAILSRETTPQAHSNADEGHSPQAHWANGIEEIEEQEQAIPEEEGEALDLAVSLAECCNEHKANDVRVLYVAPMATWTTAFVIATVFSRPQMDAVLQQMDDMLVAQYGMKASTCVQGKNSWCIVDLQTVVVHLMTRRMREFYGLDEQYAAASEVELPFATDTDTASADMPSDDVQLPVDAN